MLPTTKVMKNYPRCFPVTEEMVESWTGCSYIGETTRTHDQILDLGKYGFPRAESRPRPCRRSNHGR